MYNAVSSSNDVFLKSLHFDLIKSGWKVFEKMIVLNINYKNGLTIPFSRGSSQPRDWTQVSHIVGRSLPEPQWKPIEMAI